MFDPGRCAARHGNRSRGHLPEAACHRKGNSDQHDHLHMRSRLISRIPARHLIVSFMHDDPGWSDPEHKTLQPLENPFGTRLSPMS